MPGEGASSGTVRDCDHMLIGYARAARHPGPHRATRRTDRPRIALVRSVPPGHLTEAAVACLRMRVTAHPAEESEDGDIVFRWRRGHVLVELIGPDQPD